MDFMQSTYNISAKGKIIFKDLNEEEFQKTWKELNNLVSIYTDIDREDLTYKIEVS
jgi:hypothetical protein